MTPSETDSQQGRWFLAWFSLLPTRLFTSKTKGSREEAWTQWKKLSPDRDLTAIIGAYTKKREKHWQREIDKGVKMTSWKHAVRLLRYRFWEDDEILEAKPGRARGGLDKCKCGNKVEHVNVCFACLDAGKQGHARHWSDAMIDGMIR